MYIIYTIYKIQLTTYLSAALTGMFQMYNRAMFWSM